MKAYTLLLLALATQLHSEPAAKTPTIAREIVLRQQVDPLVVHALTNPTAHKSTPVHTAASQSIISQSEILHDGVNWTIVPKGAVLFVPEKIMDRVGARPVGTLLTWLQFLAKNPSWVSTHETSFEQAAGKSPLPDAKVDFWKKQDRVIIAVHQGGPISVAR